MSAATSAAHALILYRPLTCLLRIIFLPDSVDILRGDMYAWLVSLCSTCRQTALLGLGVQPMRILQE